MEIEALTTAMKRSISEVLETMFFLPLDFSDTVTPEELWHSGTDDIVVSKLNFSGPFSGYFLFFFPKGLALSLTAGFLGKNEEMISQDHLTATIREIINMIAGNTFSIFNDQAVFNLGIPESVHIDEVKRDGSNSPQEIFIAVNTLDNCLALKIVKESHG